MVTVQAKDALKERSFDLRKTEREAWPKASPWGVLAMQRYSPESSDRGLGIANYGGG